MKKILSLFLILLNCSAAFAESTEIKTPVKAEESATEKSEDAALNKKFEELKEITDAKMKADAGSLSRFSLRFGLTYYGPPVGDLGALNQPNPDSTVSNTATAISGSAGLRYRMSSSSSLSLTAGVSDQYPLRSVQKLDANNPSLTWDKAFRIGNVQMLSSPGATFVTSAVYRNIGQSWGVNYGLSSVYAIPDSKFAVGVDAGVSYWFYNRAYVKSDGKVRRENLTAYPVVKYNITDKLNINTSSAFSLYNPRASTSRFDLYHRTFNQRVAIGYAITRDIYVAPYIQFYPSVMGLKTTTFNIATSFSVL